MPKSTNSSQENLDSVGRSQSEALKDLATEVKNVDKLLQKAHADGLIDALELDDIPEPEEFAMEEEEEEEEEHEEESDINPDDLGEIENYEKHNREPFEREEISAMIQSGASLNDVWDVARKRGEFTKFDGSKWYRSEKKNRVGHWIWRGESYAGNTWGAGKPQQKIFHKIEKHVDKYKKLLDLYGDINEVSSAVDYLRNQGKSRGLFNKLKDLADEWEDIETSEADKETSDNEDTEPELAKEKKAADDSTPEADEEKTSAESPEADEDKESEEAADDEEAAEEPERTAGDSVYLMQNEMRRWRDPKKIKEIKYVDEEAYAKFEDEDGLFPVHKLKLAEETEEAYKPGPDQEAPTAEQLADVPDAGEVAEEVFNIEDSVAQAFSDDFEITAEELASVPGLEELTPGQQRLVLKNFRQLTFSRIQEEGLKRHREYKKDSNALYKMWQSVASTYYKGSHITEAGQELLSGGIEMHRDALEDVVLHTKESGLDLDEDGELLFARADDIEELSPKEIETIERFNKVAQDFAQTAVQWEYEGGWSFLTGSDREAYQDKLQEYQDAHNDYVTLLVDHKDLNGYSEAAEVDKRVRFAQFFASDGKYEKALQNIKDDDAFAQITGRTVLERGGYMGMGMVTRTSAAWTLSSVAAPIIATTVGGAAVGAGIGAYHGRRKAIDALEDDTRLGADGGEIEGRDLMDMVSAEELSDKLRRLMNKLDNGDLSQEKKEDAAAMLNRRIRYTKQKIDGGFRTYEDEDGNKHDIYLPSGLVDYGDSSGRAGRKYRLLQTLKEAEALHVILDDKHREHTEEINNRIDRWLAMGDEKTRKYVKERTKRGALLVGAFGGVFGALAGLSIFGGEEPGSEGGDIDYSGDENTIDSDSPSISEPDAAESEVPPPPAEEALHSQSFVIDEKGEGMIHAIADKLENDYNISHEKAMEIGNELFVKGEMAPEMAGGEDDELFNLVGKGSTFTLDFGDLTAADLESQSAEDLVKTIDFDQADFDASGSEVTPQEELPDNEPPASPEAAASPRDNPIEPVSASEMSDEDVYVSDEFKEAAEESSADTVASQSSDNPIERVTASDINESDTYVSEEFRQKAELEESRENLRKQGIEVQESGGADTDSPPEGSVDPETGESANEAAVDSQTAYLQEQTDHVSPDRIRAVVAHTTARTHADSAFIDVPEQALQDLEDFLNYYGENPSSDIITRMTDENPEVLTALDRVLSVEESDGIVDGEQLGNVHAYVREQVSHLTADDFDSPIPNYAYRSLEENALNQAA